MATLLPTLSSDDEDATKGSPKNFTKKNKEKDLEVDEDSDSGDDVDGDFEFGGLLGEDDDGAYGVGSSPSDNAWSYKAALRLLEKNDSGGMKNPERTNVASIIAAARSNIKKGRKSGAGDDDNDDSEQDDDSQDSKSGSGSSDESSGSGDGQSNSHGSSDSDSDSDSDDEVDDTHAAEKHMEGDVLKERSRQQKKKPTNKEEDYGNEEENNGNDECSNSDSDVDGKEQGPSSSDDEDEEELNEDAKAEAAKAAAFFDTAEFSSTEITVFPQLNLSRPLLRGVASMGFVTPTPIQGSVIPVALAGRDVCASAVTGSGKTAAFLLPIMERILQRGGGRIGTGSKKSASAVAAAAATRALILTPTRELAAQCVGMMTAMAKFTNLRVALVVGGAKNVAAQAAELRSRPDVVVATPGRLLDHVTNSPGVDLDDLEFLVLDEADRLLDLGFQDEVHEIVKSCPVERQTLLFSATMGTKVDDLIKLSLKRPVRVRVSDKKSKGGTDGGESSNHGGVEVAPRLEQEFVRVRTGNEGINREGMLLALLTRTFKSRAIVFFDTKATAHRLMIICGLCGIKCAELHGNLTQTQRLEALEAFREGEVDVLLATDLAARGLDISSVDTVVNFEMPSQVETYVHRIGRTARAGRGGKACTLIGEGRRYLMKAVIKDAEEKSRKAAAAAGKNGTSSTAGVIRSRTIPPAVVAHFVAKITSLEPHIEEVLSAEAVARMDRLAEMEAMRARNIIEHNDEIKSRPQKEWFASTKEKMSAKEAAAEKQRLIAEKVGTGMHRMTRKKRRAKEAKEDALQMQEEMRREQEEVGRQPEKLMTEQTMKTTARAAKRQQAEREKESYRKSIHDEDVERERRGKMREKKQKRKGAFASDTLGDGGLFDEERVAFAKKAKVEVKKPQSSYQFTDFDSTMKKRKGGKKGHNTFKSKQKYRRR